MSKYKRLHKHCTFQERSSRMTWWTIIKVSAKKLQQWKTTVVPIQCAKFIFLEIFVTLFGNPQKYFSVNKNCRKKVQGRYMKVRTERKLKKMCSIYSALYVSVITKSGCWINVVRHLLHLQLLHLKFRFMFTNLLKKMAKKNQTPNTFEILGIGFPQTKDFCWIVLYKKY